jgi:hypothetical protein
MLKNRSDKCDAYRRESIVGVIPHYASVVRCPNASLMIHDEDFEFKISFTLSLIKGYSAEDPTRNLHQNLREMLRIENLHYTSTDTL